jgi:hypothetical protein
MPLVVIVFLGFLVFVTGCADKDGAAEYLAESGYENANVTGYAFTGCEPTDFYRTAFLLPDMGFNREGTVCSTMFGDPYIVFH